MDERAAKGFVEAQNYNTYRPTYPADSVAFVRREAGIGEGSTVVDLAGEIIRRHREWPVIDLGESGDQEED